MATNWNRRKYTKEQFIAAWKAQSSICGVARALGLNIYGSTYSVLKIAAAECGLDSAHMTGAGWRKNRTFDTEQSARTELETVLVENSTYSRHQLKKRLLKLGKLLNVCSVCGIEPFWNGKALILQIDHVNGNGTDNRIENLRMLCPNCHSQTNTFAGKGKKRKKTEL